MEKQMGWHEVVFFEKGDQNKRHFMKNGASGYGKIN